MRRFGRNLFQLGFQIAPPTGKFQVTFESGRSVAGTQAHALTHLH